LGKPVAASLPRSAQPLVVVLITCKTTTISGPGRKPGPAFSSTLFVHRRHSRFIGAYQKMRPFICRSSSCVVHQNTALPLAE
jgi:hypothetical protein